MVSRLATVLRTRSDATAVAAAELADEGFSGRS
jgi:hypothetical protein